MLKPIVLKNLTLSLMHKTCFEDFSATVPYGSKIAIMGNNGTGKTTLLKTIAGQKTLIDGEVDVPAGAKIAYVAQVIEDYENLSGGERFNKSLTTALAQNPDILLLDEPTNHLDLKNRNSLMNMLSFYQGTLIVVSHDPQLLRGIDTIWHIDKGCVHFFSGNYDDYKREKEIKKTSLETQLISLEKEKKQMHKNLMAEQTRAAKSRRHGELAKERGKWPPIIAGGKKMLAQKTAGKNLSNISAKKDDINEQILALGITETITPSFHLQGKEESAPALFIMDGSAGYDSKAVLKDIYLTLSGGQKMAVIGNNASGKSTLFRAIMDEVYRISGTWNTHKKEDIGYLDQHYNNISGADNAISVIQALQPAWTHAEIRKHLNSFLFRKNEEVNAHISILSGGERARLSLAAIACKVPRLLLLDEITNNIDLQTREHVEQILISYPGAMIVISHDLEFVKTLTIENIYIVEDNTIKKINIM